MTQARIRVKEPNGDVRDCEVRTAVLLHRFIQGTADVTCVVCIVSTTTLMSMNALQSAPRFMQILMPMIDAGAALLLGYSLGQRETERLIRKAERETPVVLPKRFPPAAPDDPGPSGPMH